MRIALRWIIASLSLGVLMAPAFITDLTFRQVLDAWLLSSAFWGGMLTPMLLAEE